MPPASPTSQLVVGGGAQLQLLEGVPPVGVVAGRDEDEVGGEALGGGCHHAVKHAQHAVAARVACTGGGVGWWGGGGGGGGREMVSGW